MDLMGFDALPFVLLDATFGIFSLLWVDWGWDGRSVLSKAEVSWASE